MLDYFRQRHGKPQVYALLMLFALLGQCLWAAAHAPASELERMYVREGRLQWEGVRFAGDAAHSPFPYLVAGLPAHLLGGPAEAPLAERRLWAVRLPFMIFGLLLGASVWYVARRLYGNVGGYIALALYCFSPEVVAHSARVGAEVAAAWGFFGIIFAGIATAHTLYAPAPEAWREAGPRIALLGLAVGVGVGASFAVALALPLALAFLLYLAPGRRLAGLAMFSVSCALGLALLWAAYFLSPHALAAGLGDAYFPGTAPAADPGWMRAATVRHVLFEAVTLPGWALLGIALATYAVWRRSRYFGNTAPLLVAVALVLWMLARPAYLLQETAVWVLPYFFVFVAGICTDLLELRGKTPRVR